MQRKRKLETNFVLIFDFSNTLQYLTRLKGHAGFTTVPLTPYAGQ